MDKKGFSLIEIIFVLLLISIIITVAVSKFGTNLENANITKIKSDIIQIRAGINLYRDKMTLQNKDINLTTLDDDGTRLFSKILKNPIISSNKQEAKAWSKISDTKYKVFVSNKEAIEFTFDAVNYTFDCDISNTLCEKLNL